MPTARKSSPAALKLLVDRSATIDLLQGVFIDCKGVDFGLFFRFFSANSPLFASKNRKNRLKTTPFRYDTYPSQQVL